MFDSEQIVLATTEKHSNWSSNSLIIPAYICSISAFFFLVHLLVSRLNPTVEDESDNRLSPSGIREGIRQHVQMLGGPLTFSYRVMQLVGSLILFSLSAASLAMDEMNKNRLLSVLSALNGKWGKKHKKKHGSSFTPDEWLHAAMCLVYTYTAFLALITVTAQRRWNRVAGIHLAIVLLGTVTVYAYRNVWPLATFTQTPQDIKEGWIMWIKLAVLSLIGVVIPLMTPRQYIAVDPRNLMAQPNPEQTASILSVVTYAFLDPIVFLAYRLPHLSHTKLPPLADYDEATHLTSKSFPHLDPFSGAKRRHIFFGLLRVFWAEFMMLAVMIIIQVLAGFLSPIGINKLLQYLENGPGNSNVRPWVFISCLFFGPIICSLSVQWYIFINTRTLVRAECIITQLVFEHSLRIRMKSEVSESLSLSPAVSTNTSLSEDSDGDGSQNSDNVDGTVGGTSIQTDSTKADIVRPKDDTLKADDNLVGKITNLVTTDLGNIVEGRDFLVMVLLIPFQISLCIVFLYKILGWSAFVGLFFCILCFPVPGLVAKTINKVQIERLKTTDARVQVVTEILQTIRMSKLFGWENKMNTKVQGMREAELVWLWKRQVLDLVNGTLNFIIPLIVMLATFGSYTIVFKGRLDASTVYSSLSVFDMLREQLHYGVYCLTQTIQAKVSLDRVDDFLKNTEVLDSFDEKSKTIQTMQPPDVSTIGFNDVSFFWNSTNGTNGTMTPSRRNFKLQIEGELVFKTGAINLIVGPTGSGKTSLIHALLSEMHYVPLSIGSWYNLPREGGVAYAAQESWVQNETIRENILFGAAYDEARYKKVIYQCGMERDLSLFNAGDMTEVGEKGLTISGGQKARITLARAIYSSAQILLLDDILAALDVHTAAWIIEKCFQGDLIKNRTIIFVTHNVAMVAPIADFVISINLDGTISQGDKANAVLAAEIKKDAILIEKANEEIDHPVVEKPVNDGKLVLDEEIAEGHVGWKALKLYFAGLGGNHPILFFVTVLVALMSVQITNVYQAWYLGLWASQYETHDPSEVNALHYLGFYSFLMLVGTTIYCSCFLIYTYGILRASRKIHQQLFESILGTTLRWLDRTPTSRVITRCTQDIRSLDGPIAQGLFWLLDLSTCLISRFSAIIVFNPVFVVPVLAVAVAGGSIGQIYMKAQLSIKREMSNAKAPVLSHFGAAIAGLTSIRAYGSQHAVRMTSLKRIDLYTKSATSFYNLNRWICIRMDAIGALFATLLAAYLVYGRSSEMSPANTGFQITMAVSVSSMILWWVRVLNEFQVNSNSLERIQDYVSIEQEPKPSEQGKPPAAWPTSGDIRVENLSARYSPDGPTVLHDLSFHIKSGERVGVVGRTGSGKSSLTLALLRCILTSGEIYFDHLLTDSVNLDALRSNITIIPQIPELLAGNLRANLDPFQEHDDATLNDALRASGLFSLQSEDDENKVTLDTAVSSGGGNMSVGQRQIIALARAIVRGSKILLLDEATSAIDYKTDSVIQHSLRQELGRDVTLITVAHRLQTIMDADKIMVLDAGRMMEFDSPRELLKNEKGLLYSLVEQSGDKETLRAMALA